MSSFATIAGLCAAILAVLAWRTIHVVRAERGARRGSPPGEGVHRIEAGYWSGGAGGGHDAHFTVPRNPQDYARLFVPRQAGDRDDRSD